jgi:hypothetical protein
MIYLFAKIFIIFLDKHTYSYVYLCLKYLDEHTQIQALTLYSTDYQLDLSNLNWIKIPTGMEWSQHGQAT